MANSDTYYELANSVAEQLESDGVLIRYDFTNYGERTAQEYIVQRGTSSRVEDLLKSKSNESGLNIEFDITIIQNENEDIVTWIHEEM